MLKRAWKPLVGGLAVGAPVYAYYSSVSRAKTFDLRIPVRTADGKREMTTKTFPLLSTEAVNARLRELTSSDNVKRPNGVTWHYETAQLPSNDPIEDAYANQIIQREDSDPSSPGDYLFFAVMDGHSGTSTSQLLSKTLIKAVAIELASLSKPPSKTWSSYFQTQSQLLFDSDPNEVSRAIQRAFIALDSTLIQNPVQILTSNLDAESRKKNVIPDLSKHPLALPSMLPAVSGSCALLALLDTAHENLYLALAGDCRAVAGIWEPSEDGKGTWKADVLTEDQTGRNPKELARLQSEHPPDEASSVVKNGRILGGLEPSRAFGDARYKWPAEIQAILSRAFLEGNNKPLRPPPSLFKTPPYVTAEPVVTHRKLSLKKPSNDSLKFIVLATDGLWDELSSEDVVALVGGHLAGLKGNVKKSELDKPIPTDSSSQTIQGKEHRRDRERKTWAFVDDNISTHLIRNALGGGNELALRQLVSIPAPYSRRHRDDITVTVVWWDIDNVHQPSFTKSKL